MKKKSMISALVLSVAMIGCSMNGALADTYGIANGQTGTADGSHNLGDPELVISTPAIPDPIITQGTWSANDTINVGDGGTLGITGYTDAITNGILKATGGTVNLTGGTLTLGTDSSVGDAVDFNITGGNVALSGNGTMYINEYAGDSIYNAAEVISASGGNIVFTGDSALDNRYSFTDGSTTNVTVTQGELNISSGFTTTGTLTNGATVSNGAAISVGTLTNTGDIEGAGSITTTDGSNSSSIEQTNFTVNGAFTNSDTIDIDSVLTIGQNGSITNNGGVIQTGTIANSGTIELNDTRLTVGDGNLGGTVNVNSGDENAISLAANGAFNGALTINGEEGTALNFNSGNIAGYTDEENQGAVVNIAAGNTLNLGTVNQEGNPVTAANATLDQNDTWNGNVNLVNGSVTVNGGANFANVNYSQNGNGSLTIDERSSLRVNNARNITGGDMSISSGSTFASNAGGFTLDNLYTAGTVNAINGGYENYIIRGENEEPGMVVDEQANFQIDILGRNNGVNNNGISADGHTPRRDSDQFIANEIISADGEGATINISDWSLNGDLYGWEAPMVRHVYLNDVFQGEFNPDEIQFTADNAINDNGGVFTPIGWYKLNANPNRPGSYTLDLAKFNPWVFRGQVTKLAQYQNQLAIDDMLFTHSMVLPSFKENDRGYNASILSNRYAAGSPLYAPYEYSRKDGGVWCKMYGNFEHLNMNRGLNVENNSYGALIGADLGLRELRGGWTFMPTAYLGYNGAHQNYARQGAWQNGGQAGFLGTWYKDNFIIGALVYGGVYNNEMDTPRGNDDSFNYFAGGSIKTAYNWRFHRDWVLQPNFLVAYNFFGKENWHSDFGQMGMMSGQLHGVNVAPGLNLIWEKDTFSAYATLQYMYNVNQSVGGSAGYVGLPHIHMDRGYIQYGLGFNKRFGDRFSGYLQAVFRNVGRTGVGFQGGFNFALGKKPSNYNATLKGHTPTMQKAKLRTRYSHS